MCSVTLCKSDEFQESKAAPAATKDVYVVVKSSVLSSTYVNGARWTVVIPASSHCWTINMWCNWSTSTAATSTGCNWDRPPFSLVKGLDLTQGQMLDAKSFCRLHSDLEPGELRLYMLPAGLAVPVAMHFYHWTMCVHNTKVMLDCWRMLGQCLLHWRNIWWWPQKARMVIIIINNNIHIYSAVRSWLQRCWRQVMSLSVVYTAKKGMSLAAIILFS